MATKAKHTQTPWHARKEDGCPRSFIHTTVTDDYRCTTVVDDVSHANAEFIVKACNEHEELAAIKETVAKTLAMLHAPGFDNNGGPSNIADEVRVLLDNLNELEKERAQIYALLCGEENINGKENT